MEWKVELIKHVFWEHDAEQILGVKLPSKPREDVLAWHHDRKGLFSVKSAYRLAMALDEEEKGGRQSSSTNSCERSCWKAFWKIPIPHKILIFGWRAINNGLATQSNKNACMLSSGAHMQGHSGRGALVSLPDEEQFNSLSLGKLLCWILGSGD